MSIYLGTCGEVRLLRKSAASAKYSVLDPADVNPTRKRFSFDFSTGSILTGDQLEIDSVSGAALDFVAAAGWPDGVQKSGGKWFVHVDDIGGIRLYDTFGKALTGAENNAVALATPAAAQQIRVSVANIVPRIIGQLTAYELNTTVESIDQTVIGEKFRTQIGSLMSGSGRFSGVWDYRDTVGNGEYETAHYLLQLALRTEVGSEFAARFYLKTAAQNPSGEQGTADDLVWYEFDGLLTQASVQVSAGSIVEVTAEFVTTGQIRLQARTVAEDLILQEDDNKLQLEQDDTASLLQEVPQ